MTKVAIPRLGDQVAPRFEAARSLLIATIENGQVVSRRTLSCDGPEGYRRFRLIQIHQISTLICNGINASFLDMLVASGVTVVPNCSSRVEEALEAYLNGALASQEYSPGEAAEPCPIPHEDLVTQARRLFETSGYRVSEGPGPDAFLIDLVAEIECPVCHLPVRVAVCCGAHTYRAKQEISEFHHATRSGYHARAYVCPRREPIWECCREYGIEPLDPVGRDGEALGGCCRIPLLHGPVAEHERASGSAAE
jgi:predicted Fe-Mo cluster-binding NifX family protein